MRMPEQAIELLDYRQEKASDAFVPNPAVLTSSGWDGIYLELHQQPKFETIEHQHTMHVIAAGLSSSSDNSSGERWLDGKRTRETRNLGDIAIIPAGISHRCNWNTSVQFMVLAIEPTILKQVADDLIDRDRIELISHFMSEQDLLVQGIFLALKEEVSGKMMGHLFVDSLKTTLAIHLLRKYCTTKPKLSISANSLSRSKLQQVTEYINEHLDRDLKLIEIAAIAQMSPYHYILQRRIEKAKYLLQHSELSLAAIAHMVGFCDQSHLTRYFKRIMGMTPKQLLQAQ
jgi:AraC family transcriptional regulator